MQLDVVVTHTPSLWLRVANWLGADIKWTHALLRYREGSSSPRIIEAGAQGVIDELWQPEEYHEYGVYRLQGWCFDDETERQGVYERMYSFAAGEVGKRYRFEALPAIARPAFREPAPLVFFVRALTVAKADSIGLVARR